ncbi:MAG: single-stranded-DNA-specific exonuclease RecJ [Desulfobacterales bacterium]|nr:single-stranded-DNA-specific exonuclease RecJ [Desulfobacterales bacterium]
MKPLLQMRHPEPAVVEDLAKHLDCQPVIATVLANRGIRTHDEAQRFLFPKLGDLRPPFAMAGMTPAVKRIVSAITNKEKILIFGDYDADGVTAALLLQSFLRDAGNPAEVYLPHRIKEGYGLKSDQVLKVAVPAGIGLIVTVDCGASNHEAVDAASDHGIDVVVTDHHRQPMPLPRSLALINPQRSDCDTGFESLAGVGVAFQLAVCLRSHLRNIGFWRSRPEPDLRRLCDLVALGTVADICPMTGDNRILTRAGLTVLNQGIRPGLAALTAASGLRLGQVTATDIAFRLAPRINAAGRIGHAGLAFELLSETDPVKADTICRRLNQMNSQRQDLETEILEQIQRQIEQRPELLSAPALVLAQDDWHPGVLGIVAARLARAHSRPAVLMTTADGMAKGSARSIPGVNLHACLQACESLLEGFGGHAQAAGLSLCTDRLDDFSRRFMETVVEHSHPEDFISRLQVDCQLDLALVTADLIEAIEGLGPFGTDNPEPVFLATDLTVVTSKIVGSRHLKMTLRQKDQPAGRPVESIQFNADSTDTPIPRFFKQVAFRLGLNRWNGNRTPQMIVEAVWTS